MKKHFLAGILLVALLSVAATTYTIDQLTNNATPSSGTVIEVYDPSASPKSGKYTLTNKANATPAGITNALGISTTPTELQYVSGVTSSIQTQINAKQATGNYVTNLPGSTFTVGWTNNPSYPYETFTTSGQNITSAINSSSYGIATYGFQVVAGTVYKATFTLTLNSGTAPFFASCTDTTTGGAAFSTLTTPGANTFTWVSQRTGTEYLTFWNDNGVASNFAVSSMAFVSLTSITAETVTATPGWFSSPQNNTSERFGANSNNKTFTNSVAVGYGAVNSSADAVALGYRTTSTTSGYSGQAYGGQPVIVGSQSTGNGVALGYKATASNFEALALGQQTLATAPATIAIGDAARATSSGGNGNETVIGDVAWATGNVDLIIGSGSGTARDYIIALGSAGSSVNYDKEVATANHQGFLGWYQQDSAQFTGAAGYVNDWWIGGPVTAQAPHAITLNTTSAQGTNVAGVNTTHVGSLATGNAASGDIIFSTGDVGASGTNIQTATAKFTIKGSGAIAVTKTITAGGTTGDQTINKVSGSVNFAAAAQTITVTNSLVTTSSVIMATVATDDTTAKSCIAVPGTGSFVLKLNAAATAETRVQFLITN